MLDVNLNGISINVHCGVITVVLHLCTGYVSFLSCTVFATSHIQDLPSTATTNVACSSIVKLHSRHAHHANTDDPSLLLPSPVCTSANCKLVFEVCTVVVMQIALSDVVDFGNV